MVAVRQQLLKRMQKKTPKRTVDLTRQVLSDSLNKRGHETFSWDDIEPISLPNGVVSKMFRVGCPIEPSSPTVFKVYFPPECLIEAHTHDCDYTEIILEGSQKVGAQWLHAGDIRVGLANRGYGPLLAGPHGVTIMFVFKTGNWPAKPIGNNDGSSLHSDVIANSIR